MQLKKISSWLLKTLQRQDMEEREETQRNRQPQKPVVEKKPRQEKRNRQNGGHSEYVVSGAPWHQQVCYQVKKNS